MADIVIDRIARTFGAVHGAAGDRRSTVADGEFVALLGPSGCGKTTLLRIIAGLETQSAGRVLIGGRDVTDLAPRERGLAMVFQNYAVFPHMTVFENIAFGLRMQKSRRRDDRAQGRATRRALLHIEPYLDRYPGQALGRPAPARRRGPRARRGARRAAHGRAAVQPRRAAAAGDARGAEGACLREAGTTTVYVTHDQTEAMGLADRIAVMHGGRIVQMDAPTEVYAHPATSFVGGWAKAGRQHSSRIVGAAPRRGRWSAVGRRGSGCGGRRARSRVARKSSERNSPPLSVRTRSSRQPAAGELARRRGGRAWRSGRRSGCRAGS